MRGSPSQPAALVALAGVAAAAIVAGALGCSAGTPASAEGDVDASVTPGGGDRRDASTHPEVDASGDAAAPQVDAADAADAQDRWADPARPGWTLSWHDEFDGPANAPVDATKWAFDIGGGGWGNAEAEYYTDRTQNVHLDGSGHLTIRAFNEAYKGMSYTSARLKTAGKMEATYGRFEVRARMPLGRGLWPAFWLLGSNVASAGWPGCGEIDAMEFIGSTPGVVRGSLHGPGYSAGGALSTDYHLPAGQSFTTALHVFAVEWEASEIRFFVDDELYARRTPAAIPAGATWAFDNHPFFVILNLAVGGILPGSPDDTTTFPQDLVVDYVRVYRR